MKLITPAGKPTSSIKATNLCAITGVVEAGFSNTVFPETTADTVIPTQMASGKFHGGITTPTPSGM
ncbi:hypothetical protein D3C85_1561830 [compost metagenome]